MSHSRASASKEDSRPIWSASMVVALVVFLAGANPVRAADDSDDCQQRLDIDRSIAACTRVLQNQGASAQLRALGYNRRGYDYFVKGQLDRAIEDYSQAIQL